MAELKSAASPATNNLSDCLACLQVERVLDALTKCEYLSAWRMETSFNAADPSSASAIFICHRSRDFPEVLSKLDAMISFLTLKPGETKDLSEYPSEELPVEYRTTHDKVNEKLLAMWKIAYQVHVPTKENGGLDARTATKTMIADRKTYPFVPPSEYLTLDWLIAASDESTLEGFMRSTSNKSTQGGGKNK